MPTMYVELYRPNTLGLKPCRTLYRVHKVKDFSLDCLSPTMLAVFAVEMVKTKEDAIAAVMLHAAGFSPCVRLCYGGKKKTA